MCRFAPSAIPSTQASRKLLLPMDVLTSSIVSTAFSNKVFKSKGLSLEPGSALSGYCENPAVNRRVQIERMLE